MEARPYNFDLLVVWGEHPDVYILYMNTMSHLHLLWFSELSITSTTNGWPPSAAMAYCTIKEPGPKGDSATIEYLFIFATCSYSAILDISLMHQPLSAC